ncbi:MAG TPA: L-histidine N(alpha)-methyltransferase [Mycobacteriales bacterium]|nr:L-histidine N(alpha)-methyltransferase [Mycobacteriales bacterium]
MLTVDVHLAQGERRAALLADAAAGLTASPKSMPPLWFYDERGSRLFDDITKLAEYYPTRAERAILATHASDIVGRAGADTLVELGSGSSEKTRLLLTAMAAAGSLHRFVPFDVSEVALREAAARISREFAVEVRGVVGDFHRHLGEIPTDGRRLVAFLGGTIGNLTPAQRAVFLADLAAGMTRGDTLLLGTDLVKSPQRLVRAYDDSLGVTAEFNRNLLQVLNNELGADFDLAAFDHVAVWDADAQWIEMRLRSRVAQSVHVTDLDLIIGFDEGEYLLTEISAKFTPERIEHELATAGFGVEQAWTDPDGDFQLTLARPLR